ncbi:hypothetical protein ALC57_05237 [Trachymyrmex cornetzi]|uniref:DUF5641 domain-containing protein n=1 Tax=Trachymyrmex cornetzi TaxID=471704 RepID=A0A151JB85_9HYME|nr:hypothetical protein ALC57_05237 [Trachymyrmex cornetzi]
MSSSSFMAIRCLQETAYLKKDYPRASETILKDFYVDDLLTGANSIEELKELKNNVNNILFNAKFELAKWKSNAPEINDRSISGTTVNLGQSTKILGLWWNTATDTFHYPSFLNAIKRFISRRGRCINLYSDNSTTFVGANNQLSELKKFITKDSTQAQLREYLTEQFITHNWKFIPPYSPHMGGLWETAVKSAKTHMKKIIGTFVLSFEELYTVVVQIEACLNSRPLTPMSSHPDDLQVLTPGYFIIGEALNALPDYKLSETPVNRLTRYQLITQLKQNFWSRWSREYIAQQQHRFEWKCVKDTNIKIGNMVLIKNENTPPMIWPLDRITETHPGSDGITRVVSRLIFHNTLRSSRERI